MTLEQRIARLEAMEAIRQLKHRYLNACDLKEVETIRDCFATGPIVVDFEAIGRFEDRDSFVAKIDFHAVLSQSDHQAGFDLITDVKGDAFAQEIARDSCG